MAMITRTLVAVQVVAVAGVLVLVVLVMLVFAMRTSFEHGCGYCEVGKARNSLDAGAGGEGGREGEE